MKKTLLGVIALCAVGCASYPAPNERTTSHRTVSHPIAFAPKAWVFRARSVTTRRPRGERTIVASRSWCSRSLALGPQYRQGEG
jgi:hypothetical protein